MKKKLDLRNHIDAPIMQVFLLLNPDDKNLGSWEIKGDFVVVN